MGSREETRGAGLLLVAAFIWGTALVAQSAGLENLGPFAFNAARFFLGALALAPILAARRLRGAVRAGIPRKSGKRTPWRKPACPAWRAGVWCGTVLFVTASLQQCGLASTPVGKAGFLTALYIVIVPVAGLVTGRKVARPVWGGVALAMAGLYLLCLWGTLWPGKGDVLVLLCAFSTAAHILLTGRFAPRVDGVVLSCVQFLVCGGLSLGAALVAEQPDVPALLAAWAPIVYTGVLSCGVAYTLQILGQKTVSPVLASLLLSLEAVFSALAGWLALGETLSAREAAGCALIFLAVMLAQWPGTNPARVEEAG